MPNSSARTILIAHVAALTILPAPLLASVSTTSRISQAGSGLSGFVVDAQGRPITRARVAIDELGRAVLSDSAGRFSLGNVPTGRYTLVVSRAGFKATSRKVLAGEAGGIRIALEQYEERLPLISVTAARSPVRVDESPFPTSELRDDALHQRTNVSIARAIERLPGVRSLNTGDQIAKPVIRGLSGSRVLVLDNGMRLEDYSWSDEDGPSVEARLADRIEVIRGPASLLYGSDAIGGVVNSVPSALPTAAGGSSFRRLGVETFVASNNRELGGMLRTEGATGKWGWRAAGIGRFAEDLHTPAGKLDNTGFVAANGEGAVAYHGDRGTSTLRYTRYGGEYKLLEASPPPGGEEEEGGPERVLGDDRLQFSGNYVIGNSLLETRVQYQRHNLIEKSDDLVASGGPKDAEVFNLLLNSVTTDVLLHRSAGSRGRITGGVTALHQSSDSRGPFPIIPDATTTSAGAFALVQYDLPIVTLLAGARGEGRHVDVQANGVLNRTATTRSNSAVSADVGAVVRVGGGVSLTGNLGRAWRAPTLFEMFANGPRLGEARFEIGDPNLNAEHSINVDGGIRWTGARARVEASAFHNAITDFIYINPTGTTAVNLPVYRYDHADASLDGIEIGAEVRATDALTLRARHDFVNGRNSASDTPLPLMPPSRTDLEAELHPSHLGGVVDPTFGIEVELNARQRRLAQFDIPTDAFTLLHLQAGFAGHLSSHEVHVGIEVRNLLDTEYRSFLSRYKVFAPDAGRNVIVRLSTGI